MLTVRGSSGRAPGIRSQAKLDRRCEASLRYDSDKIAIMPVTVLAVNRRLGFVKAGANFHLEIQRKMTIANCFHRAVANSLPIPVIHHDHELIVKCGLRDYNTITLVLKSMRSVVQIDIELADHVEIHIPKVFLNNTYFGVFGLKLSQVFIEFRVRATELGPIINGQGTNNISMNSRTQC
jgi:hypothetical protein